MFFFLFFFQNIRLKVSAFDHDRHSKTSEIGSLSVLLKDVKHLATAEDPIVMTNFLAQKKQVGKKRRSSSFNFSRNIFGLDIKYYLFFWVPGIW